ncbi:hypothetical protein SAMN06295879_3432 [Agreia bicolorata]|uniref:Uncharacterized protein n=1 Tax=Agreia bicolorata TaxID=110935 RepID=A0A1T4YK82_9MICO|nr:hypothetical protein SAMN06295879_3432 [Agreia bicolorata]
MNLKIKISVAANESDQKSSRIKAKNREVLAERIHIRAVGNSDGNPAESHYADQNQTLSAGRLSPSANGSSFRSIMKGSGTLLASQLA